MNEARINKIAKRVSASFDDYDSQLGEAIGKHGQDIHGWKASWEYPGYIEWSKNGESKTIQATPFFEGRPSICVQVTDDGEDLGGFDIPMRKTENVDHDAIQYLNLMRTNWTRIESFLKVKSASMKAADSRSGYEAFKALEAAWDNLNSAKQSLQTVLRDDKPDNPQEIASSIKELEHICWMVSVYKRQTNKLSR